LTTICCDIDEESIHIQGEEWVLVMRITFAHILADDLLVQFRNSTSKKAYQHVM
jgi:hypothetical protein